MTSIVWNSKEFEGISPENHSYDVKVDILDYIHRFLQRQNSADEFVVLMPSLKTLMGFFECSHLDIQEVLGVLKAEGYDYMVPGLYGHISLYKTPII